MALEIPASGPGFYSVAFDRQGRPIRFRARLLHRLLDYPNQAGARISGERRQDIRSGRREIPVTADHIPARTRRYRQRKMRRQKISPFLIKTVNKNNIPLRDYRPPALIELADGRKIPWFKTKRGKIRRAEEDSKKILFWKGKPLFRIRTPPEGLAISFQTHSDGPPPQRHSENKRRRLTPPQRTKGPRWPSCLGHKTAFRRPLKKTALKG